MCYPEAMKKQARNNWRFPWLLVAAGALAAAGCTNMVNAPPSTSLLLVRGSAEVAGEVPTWCYQTLADADCYVAPDEAARHRELGAYVPVGPPPGPGN